MGVAGALLAGSIVWITTQPLRNEARRQLSEMASLRARVEAAGLEERELAARRDDVRRLTRSLAATESALQQANRREEALRRRVSALNGGKPELVGPPSPTKSPQSTALQRPEILAAVQGRAGKRGSGGNVVPGVQLLSPVGTYLREDRPTFTWAAFPDAVSYELVVYTAQGQEIARDIGITEPRRTLGRSLPRGKVYRWEVIANGGGREIGRGPAAGAAFAQFGIFSTAQLQIAEAVEAESRLTRAAGLARVGLLDEAGAELDALAASPASPDTQRRAHALRDEIRGWRK